MPLNSKISSSVPAFIAPIGNFFRRLALCLSLMSRLEKAAALFLFLTAISLTLYRAETNYRAATKLVPAAGGEYKEALVGELKYLNPVLAQASPDRSAAELVFSGLVQVNKKAVAPDIAESWDISADGLTYTFHIKKNVLFHDGRELSARDVAYTLETVKAYESKSPLYEAWKDVKVSVPDDYTIIFELPKPYGPFIYNCSFGIIPSYLSSDDLAKKFIGSGPYRFVRSRTDEGRITELELSRNEDYYGDKPNITKLNLHFFDQAEKAKDAFEKNKVDGLFGTAANAGGMADLTFDTAKRFGLIFNLRNARFQDKEFRRKIISGENFIEKTKLRLVTLDLPLQKAKAEELKVKLADRNVNLEVIYLNAVQLQDVLDSKEFECLLYGYDFGYDRDAYAYWHSSQIDKRNYAGYKDTQADLLLEGARMTLDPVERNKKYDQFFDKLNQDYIVQFFDPMKYNFYLSAKVKGASEINGYEAESHLDGIKSWYIKEKRVKK